MGRRQHRKAWTRAQLVRAGRELFGEKGLYEARIEDLAQHAGIAKGTVYLYFEGKVDLVRAVVEAGFEELERDVRAAVEGRRSFGDLVGRIVQAHVDFLAANPDLMRIFHQVRGILKFRREEWLPVRRPLMRHVGHITELLGRAPSPVRHRPSDRRVIAAILFGAISGGCSVRATLGSGPAAERWAHLLRTGLVAMAVGLARERRPRRRRRPRP